MDVNGSRLKGTVSKKGLQGNEIHAVLIRMGGVCMSEGMGGKPAVDVKFQPLFQNDLLEPLFIHRSIQGTPLCEDPLLGSMPGREREPVL